MMICLYGVGCHIHRRQHTWVSRFVPSSVDDDFASIRQYQRVFQNAVCGTKRFWNKRSQATSTRCDSSVKASVYLGPTLTRWHHRDFGCHGVFDDGACLDKELLFSPNNASPHYVSPNQERVRVSTIPASLSRLHYRNSTTNHRGSCL